MFSSNQLFTISGRLDQLENAIIFLLSHAGLTHESLRNPQRALVYQITEDNKYHLGLLNYLLLMDGKNICSNMTHI